MISPSYSQLLRSWSSELASRTERIRNVIGDRHWPTDGRHKEMILGEMIERYLPSNFSLCSGFIGGAGEQEISPEIDLYIADHSKCPPLLNECGVQVTRSTSVLATIEVKSTFNANHLDDATFHLGKTVATFPDAGRQCWNGIFFFGTSLTSAYDYGTALLTKIDQNLSDFGETGPCVIAILGTGLAFYTRSAHQSKLRYFPIGELATGLWLIDMLEWILDVDGGSGQMAIIEQLPELADTQPQLFEANR